MHPDVAGAGIEFRVCEPHSPERSSVFFSTSGKNPPRSGGPLVLSIVHICTIIRVERYYVLE